MSRVPVLLGAVALASVAAASAAGTGHMTGRTWRGFTLPGRSATCTRVSAVVKQPNVVCTTRAVAAQGPGGPTIWAMRPRGRAVRKVWLNGSIDENVPVLRYGRTIKWYGGAIRCTSHRTGLTCRNLSGHGFFLSPGRQRIF
jgi:hypothetical protein